jgi:probable HAF family extracellular repeat protein
MKRFLCGVMALGLLLGSAGHAKTQPTYAFTRLDPGPYTSDIPIIPYGINASGQIVGTHGFNEGFLFDHGTYTVLPNTTIAQGINSTGQIVGISGAGAFLFENGNYTTLEAPGAQWTEANGINASGQIVGAYYDATGEHGFLLSNGSYTTLDVPGADWTAAFGINASGQIVDYFGDAGGIHVFLATPVP